MKYGLLLLILGSLLACDPYGFGFKKNPAHVLDLALVSILNQDTDGFADVAGDEALCVYANPKAMTYLHERVRFNTEDVKLRWESEDRYLDRPEFVGFWSYFSSRYSIDIEDKSSASILARVIVDCHYGTDGAKDDRFQNLAAKKYPTKDCRLVKVLPKTFEALPIPENCRKLTIAAN